MPHRTLIIFDETMGTHRIIGPDDPEWGDHDKRRREGYESESGPHVVPVWLLRKWTQGLEKALGESMEKTSSQDSFYTFKGMKEGARWVQHRIDSWIEHQVGLKELEESDQDFFIAKDVDLSDGRYKKLEWYEAGLFVSLAYRWGTPDPEPTLHLHFQSGQHKHICDIG